MAQLDVYPNPDRETVAIVPYVLDIQSNLLGILPTVAVIPLIVPAAAELLPILRLNPKLVVEQQTLIALTQDIASIPRRLLARPITNLTPQRDEILAALDFLFTGF
jgi:toxin CcdB